MKNIILSFLLALFTAATFAQGLVIHKTDGSKIRIPYSEIDSVTTYEPEAAAGDGTLLHPFTPTEANAFVRGLAADVSTDNDVYIKGIICYIKEKPNSQYGNATFFISEDGQNMGETFYVFRCYGLGNIRFTDDDVLRVGDEVMICGKVVNYKGNTPETTQGKAYVYSLNGSRYGESANTNANDASANKDLARWEIPSTRQGNLFITNRTDDGLVNYCLEYDFVANHSRWVAYRFDSKLGATTYPNRTDAWAPDPSLASFPEHQVSTGYFPGYNRGHLLGSAERYYSTQANEQTFYMSNMSPMQGDFNATYWSKTEELVRNWGRHVADGDTMYVVKGGILDMTIGTINVKNTLGRYVSMVVPQYHFIAVLYRKSGRLQAIGFWMENKDYANTDPEFLNTLPRESSCSIDMLEELTGIDFFCNLPDDTEANVEAEYDITKWSGL